MKSSFFHRLHTYVRDTYFRAPATNAAVHATQKEYPRMQRIQLHDATNIPPLLHETLRARRSSVQRTGAPISLSHLSDIFDTSLRLRKSYRPYPSGGGLYPIEVYCIVSNATDVAPGVYHYRPDTHELERLWDTPHGESLQSLINDTDDNPPSALIVLTAIWERSAAKYSNFAYELALLEAGHIAQNILLCATALSCESRPFGGFDAEKIGTILDIDTAVEDVVYTVALSA